MTQEPAAARVHLKRLGGGLLAIAAVLALLSPLMLPDPWDVIYAVTVVVLGSAYLIGKDVIA